LRFEGLENGRRKSAAWSPHLRPPDFGAVAGLMPARSAFLAGHRPRKGREIDRICAPDGRQRVPARVKKQKGAYRVTSQARDSAVCDANLHEPAPWLIDSRGALGKKSGLEGNVNTDQGGRPPRVLAIRIM